MKTVFSFSLILFISGLFIVTGINEKKHTNSNKQIKNIVEVDSTINKLPDGYLFITNFNLTKRKKIISISQDSSGMMLLLSSKGVLFFDGMTEEELFIENNPNIIKKDTQLNQFYIACSKGFGLLKKDKFGKYVYEIISSNKINDENYKNIIVTKDKVWFISTNKIVSIDPHNYIEYKTEYLNQEQTITGAFEYNEKLYFSMFNKGLNYIENDTLYQVVSDSIFKEYEILFDVPFNDKKIIGASNNSLYLFDGKTYKKFKTDAQDYIKESIITGGFNFNDKEFVISTLNGGAILINKDNGTTVQTINYRTGLPDDEVYAAYSYQSGSIWLSHDYGISRVAFDIPVTNYGYYPGLQGKVNFVKVYDSTLYVATGEGLFQLSEIKSYDEVEIATKKRVKSASNNFQSNNETLNDINYDEGSKTETEEEGFFDRWKKRRQKKKIEDIADNSTDDSPENTNTEKNIEKKTNTVKDTREYTYKTITEYKKIYELQSVKYTYKKIPDINSKCRHLKTYSDGLLASTNSGLFYIQKNQVSTIIAEDYIYNVSGNDSDNTIFSAGSKGIHKINTVNGKISAKKIVGESITDLIFNQVFKVNNETLWAVSLNKLYLLKLKDTKVISTEKFNIETDQNDDLHILNDDGKITFLNSDDAYYFNEELNDIIEQNEYYQLLRKTDKIYKLSDTSAILTGNSAVLKYVNYANKDELIKYSWLIDYIESFNLDKEGNIWVVSRDNSIYKIKKNNLQTKRKFEIFINEISDSYGNIYRDYKTLTIESSYKNLNVKLSSPCYLKRNFVSYSYSIDSDKNENFISFSNSQLIIPELTSGDHTLYLRAKNGLNEISNTIEIKIVINPPFWQTTYFLIGVFLILMLIVSLSISGFYRRKQKKIKEYNQILELKVKERTYEIEQQNTLIQNQNIEIYEQYEKINLQNEEINGSIRYAGKIQKAALPNLAIHEKYLSGFFNLYKPRDIVSGDFYWMNEAQNKLFIAAVDCTGHGVPGGFLSMLGISFLNEIVIDLSKKEKEIKASEILNILRNKVIATLSHHGDSITSDGMDMALAIIDKEKMVLNFAGANNPAYIIRNNQLSKIDADRMPIGYNKKLNETKFKNKYIQIMENDTIYLFSDGYADQFGGLNGKKFNSRRFRELLIHIHRFPMSKQKEIANNILEKWQQDHSQIDDILLIGIKI